MTILDTIFRRPQKQKILFLADSYVSGPHKYSPYLESLLAYLKSLSCPLLVVRTNSFLHSTFAPRLTYLDNYKQMLSEIRSFDPDLVFSVNRNGLTEEVITDCLRPSVPIISWIVDSVDQIQESFKRISNRDLITAFTPGIGPGINSKENLAKEFGTSNGQLSAFPFFTDTFHFHPKEHTRSADVSFVASAYDQSMLTNFIAQFANVVYASGLENADAHIHKNLDILVDTYKKHENNYVKNLYTEMRNQGFNFDILRERDPSLWSAIQYSPFFQGYFDAHITSQKRVKCLAALSGLKLEAYGVPQFVWSSQLCAANIELIRSFNFRLVATYRELSEIYNRSKMSLNVQTYASCGTGFSFRVFDILNCKTLLLTESSAVPVFEHIGFKNQVHFISFGSPEELRVKADHFIQNESERLKIVEAAYNQLQPLLETCSLKSVLVNNFKEVGMADLAKKIRTLSKEAYMVQLDTSEVEHVKTLGW